MRASNGSSKLDGNEKNNEDSACVEGEGVGAFDREESNLTVSCNGSIPSEEREDQSAVRDARA